MSFLNRPTPGPYFAPAERNRAPRLSCSPSKRPGKLGLGTVLLLLLLSFCSFSPAAAQPGFSGAPDDTGFNFRVYPADVWGPRSGPGIGLGVVGHNLARRHDQWLLTAAPARYEQVATAAFASANPRRATRYVLVDSRALHTDRQWYGPPEQRTVLERTELRTRIRVGRALFQRTVLIQPHVTLSHQSVDAVNQPANGPDRINAALPAPGIHQTGLRAGVEFQFDTRDRPVLATQGFLLQAKWDRYVPLEGADLQFDQVDLDAYGYLPLGGGHRFVPRLSLTLTRTRSDVPVPVFELPTLGGSRVPGWARGRFVDSDRLIGSVLYRFPLFRYEKLAAVEGHLGGHLASVYGNLSDQFTTSVSFEENPRLNSSDRPLRPAASAGIRFAVPLRPHVSLDLAVGMSPEGATAVRLSFVRSLQSLRFPHHTSDNLR